MKDKLMCIGKSFALLLGLTLLFSLVFAALYYFHVISQTVFHTLNWIFGWIAFFFAGCILGFGIKKKALFHAFLCILIYGIVAFFFLTNHEVITIIEFISKLFAYLLGVVVVLNFRKSL